MRNEADFRNTPQLYQDEMTSAAEARTIYSTVAEIFVFSVGDRSARISLCLTRATPLAKTTVTHQSSYDAQRPPAWQFIS